MKIAKILNNNVAIVLGEQGQEQVMMGRGLAFNKRVGDALDTQLIEKVFALQNPRLTNRLSELLSEIPIEVITTTELIIARAREQLGSKLHESLSIALCDHCNFAIVDLGDQDPLSQRVCFGVRRAGDHRETPR